MRRYAFRGHKLLSRVTAIEFIRTMNVGRTGPALLLGEKPDFNTIEMVTKFSHGCDQKEINLAGEVIGACLAADLGLPVPEPFLVEISSEFIDSIPDAQFRTKVATSNRIAFGSSHLTGQYSLWSNGSLLSDFMIPSAAAIMTFDGIIQNPDRRSDNPNCLTRGEELRIFDHELAFTHGMVIGWKAPWTIGGLSVLETPGFHIFKTSLQGKLIDYHPIRASWLSLTDERIASYGSSIPPEWSNASNFVASALQLVKNARDNIDACLTELDRVLK